MTTDNPGGFAYSVTPLPGSIPYLQSNYNNRLNPVTNSFSFHYGYEAGSIDQSGYQRQIYEKWELKPKVKSFQPQYGICNSASDIKIFGKYFTGTTAVKFGVQPASYFNVISDSVIVAKNANGYTGSITVEKNSNSATSQAIFNVGSSFKDYSYIPNISTNTVSAVDNSTGAVISVIPVGSNPKGICTSVDGSKVFVANYSSDSIYIIETNTNTITGKIKVGKRPFSVATHPNGYWVYTANNGGKSVSKIDILNKQVSATISDVGIAPTGIVCSPDGTKIYVSNWASQDISVIDHASNLVIARIPIGSGVQGIAISPDGKKIYTAGSGIYGISTLTYTIEDNIAIGVHSLVVSLDGEKLYVSRNNDSISIINTLTKAVITSIKVGISPSGISLSPDALKLYVSCSNGLYVINLTTNTLENTFAVNGSGNFANYSGNFIANKVDVACTPIITSYTPTGCPNAWVNIQGSGFYNVSSITVGSSTIKQKNIRVITPNSIWILTDTATESGKITIKTNGGTVTSTDTLWLCPYISSFTPNSGCGGTFMTIKGYNFHKTDSVTIGGVKTSSYTLVDKNTITTTTNAGMNGNVQVYTKYGNWYRYDPFESNVGTGEFAYIPDRINNCINVINTATDSLLKSIKLGSTIIGNKRILISVAPNGKKVYVNIENSNLVNVINTLTLKVDATINLAAAPVGLCFSPDGNTLYVANDYYISVLNTNTNTILTTIPVTGIIRAICINSSGSNIYTANYNGKVCVINAATNIVSSYVTVGGALYGLFLDNLNNRLYINGSNSYADVIDLSSNTVLPIYTIPKGYITFSKDGSKLFSFSGDNPVSIVKTIELASNSIISTTPITINNPITGVSFNPDGDKLFLLHCCGVNPNVTVVDYNSYIIIDTFTTGQYLGASGNFISKLTLDCPPTISSLSNTNSCVGQTISIYGVGFDNAYSVKFGNAPAKDFTIISDNEIQAIIDKGKTGLISVSNLGGTSYSTQTLRIGNVPNFTVMPSPFQLCGGTSRNLATNLEDTTIVFTCSNGQTGKTVAVNATGTYNLTATDTVGCINTASFSVSNLSTCGGYLELETTPYIRYFDDTISVKVKIKNGVNIFSTFAYLNYNTTYLTWLKDSSKTGNYLGNNILNNPPVLNGSGQIDFGISRKTGQPGSNGDGTVYEFKFLLTTLPYGADFDSLFPSKTKLAFSLSNINVYNTSGTKPPSFNNISLLSDTTICNYYVPVWPGDLNNDKKVNVADLLPIGYFYGATGPIRPNASLAFKAQPAPIWGNDKTAKSSNAYKVFADGTADGVIDLADQAAIGFNLSRTHARGVNHSATSTIKQEHTLLAKGFPANMPAVNVNIPDTLVQSTALPLTEQVSITMGSSAYPVSNLYGVAFEIYFDTNYVDFNNITTDYLGSIFGTRGTDFTQIEDYFEIANGKLSIGLTRYNTTAINATGGRVLNINFPMIASAPSGWFKITAIPIACNDKLGNNIVITGGEDSLRINGGALSIVGRCITPLLKPIKNATCSLKGITTLQSDNVGSYQFSSGIITGSNVVIKPTKNNDIKKNNGVSSIDVILTQRHILNTAKLNSPYKIIAADVNNNKTITNIDVIFMKRLILGIDTSFTGNRLWAFVDSSYQFPDTTNPFPYKDSISFTNLSSNKTNQTFIGVKLGDVNYDWNPALARGKSIDNLELIIDNAEPKVDKQLSIVNYQLPIKVKNFKDLTALQYTLHFDNSKYEFVAIENNKLGIEFNAQQANKTGNISFLWADAKGEENTLEDGTELFTLVLKAKELGFRNWELGLSLTNDITEIEAWDKDNLQHNIVLIKRETKNEQLQTRNEWFCVSPNPNNGNIVVSLSSNTNKTIVFELSNAVGKSLYSQSVEAVNGSNSFHLNLNKNTKLASGVYFIKAKGLEGDNVKRIVVKS